MYHLCSCHCPIFEILAFCSCVPLFLIAYITMSESRLLQVSSELSRIILIDFTGYRIGFTVRCSNLLDYFPPAISFFYVNKQ